MQDPDPSASDGPPVEDRLSDGPEAATPSSAPAPATLVPDAPPSHFQSDEPWRPLLDAIAGVDDRTRALIALVEKRLLYDHAKEAAFDRLYEELDFLKRGRDFEQLRPLYVDLILLYDRICNIRQTVETGSVSGFLETLQTLEDELLELLRRRGLDLLEPSSAVFAPSIQRAVGTEPTSLETEGNRVARVVRRGFVFGDRVIRPEEVIVRKVAPAGTT